MFSQLAKRSARVLPADLCTDHAHYVKVHRSTVLRRNKNMAVEGGTVSHYYILVIREFFYFMSLFRIVCGFLFLLNNFPLQSLEYATYSSILWSAICFKIMTRYTCGFFPRILAIIPATRYTCVFLPRILAFFLTNTHMYAQKKAHIYALQTSMWYMGSQKLVV